MISLSDPVVLAETPDPSQGPGAWQALASGLTDRRAVIAHDGNQYGLQVELTPAGARRLLGLPAGALGRAVVDLADVLGSSGRDLPERMAAQPSWLARFALLDQALLGRAARVRRNGPRPELEHAWSLLVGSGGAARVSDVARAVGWSRRHLADRFAGEYGLSARGFGSLVRFERSRRLLQTSGGRTLADVAADCGYADQAHLAREWQRFAGCPPTAWLRSEEFPSVQDGAYEPRHSG